IHTELGDDASSAYNEQIVFGFTGELDVTVLREALQDVALHHEALRTVFDRSGDRQHVLPSIPIDLRVTQPASDGRSALLEALKENFNVSSGPLFRVHAHSQTTDYSVLQIVFHHLVMDALGSQVFLRDLAMAYKARQGGKVPQLPRAMQFSEYATL